jgi:dephospho-CoA kinase
MKLCGLTGGVGMGKSTAAGFFLQSGLRIVDTDELARQLVEPGQPALAEIRHAFGGGLIADDGSLKRGDLARMVFADVAARKTLEAILHPRIRECWHAQVNRWRREECPAAMVVIPLLFETRAEPDFDRIICVACSAAAQRERLRQRGWPAGQIEGRIAAQLPVTEKIARSDYVIWTDGLLENHRRQAAQILSRL